MIKNPQIESILRFGLSSNKNRSIALKQLNESFNGSNKEAKLAAKALKNKSFTYDDIYEILEGKTLTEADNEVGEIVEGSPNKIPIVDTTHTDDDTFIAVSMDDVIDFTKKGTYYGADADEPDASQKKILSAFNQLSRLSQLDQDDVRTSINKAVDVHKQKSTNALTKKKFFEAINDQLTYEERVQFVAFFLRQSKDTFNRNK